MSFFRVWRPQTLERDSMTDEKRGARQRVLIECVVKNISDTGCTLRVTATIGISQDFDLMIGGVRHHCRVKWKAGTKMGMKFE